MAFKWGMSNEKKLAIGTLTTVFGNKVFDISCNVFIAQMGAAASFFTAIYQSSESFIAVLVNLFAGVWADRSKDKRRILVVTDFLCGLVCLILTFLMQSAIALYAIIATNIILSILETFNSPAAKTIVRFALPKERIAPYNSYIKGIREVLKISSPFVSGIILYLFSIPAAIFFNAVTFFVSALCEYRLIVEPSEDSDRSQKKPSFLRDLHDVWIYLKTERALLFIIIVASLYNFFIAGFNLFMPYTYKLVDSAINPYTIFVSAEAVGGLMGAFITAKLKKTSTNHLVLFLFLSGLSILLLYAAFALSRSIYPPMVAIALFSIFLTCFNIVFTSKVQTDIDERYIGRVFSFIVMVALLLMPVGSFFFAAVFTSEGTIQYLFSGAGIVLMALASYFICHKFDKA
ncbi:MAG: MFS transporter [Eubacteriales bacterium]|nr:MFS transporter [Eubacteriales bacterium]